MMGCAASAQSHNAHNTESQRPHGGTPPPPVIDESKPHNGGKNPNQFCPMSPTSPTFSKYLPHKGMQRRSQLSFNTELSIHDNTRVQRANKIVCTIGPITQSVEMLTKLIKAGMNVARMNFSHGSHEYHATTIANIRQAAKDCGVHIGIALDTKGPEIRLGRFDPPEAKVIVGQELVITTDEAFKEIGTADKFYVDYKNIAKVVAVGGTIYVDDGNMDLEVLEVLDGGVALKCRARNSYSLSSNKGVNLPEANVDLPAVSEQDKRDLAFGAAQGVDIVFASFIRSADQVKEVRESLGEDPKKKHRIHIISKIENWQGVDNIDEIIRESDGIMVARGDLGVEIPAWKVVSAQKMIISKCNVAGKPVICATQMLESMTTNPRPTRAEVSDVANAVLDGSDCVMLSGETAKGKYPIETVEHMARICVEAQKATWNTQHLQSVKVMQKLPMSPEEATCVNAVGTIAELGAKALIVLTNTGKTARLIAKYRPFIPVVCVGQQDEMCRQVQLTRSVFPVHYDVARFGEDVDREKRVAMGIDYAVRMGFVKPGDMVLAVHADKFTKGFANLTRALIVE